MTSQPEIVWPAHLNDMSERAFQDDVIAVAAVCGWVHYAALYSVGADKGYPDLTLVHPHHGVRWFELKTERSGHNPSAEQVHWLGILRESGQGAYLGRPRYARAIGLLLQGLSEDEAWEIVPDQMAAMIAESTPEWLMAKMR